MEALVDDPARGVHIEGSEDLRSGQLFEKEMRRKYGAHIVEQNNVGA